jgi:hypothetical protein
MLMLLNRREKRESKREMLCKREKRSKESIVEMLHKGKKEKTILGLGAAAAVVVAVAVVAAAVAGPRDGRAKHHHHQQ